MLTRHVERMGGALLGCAMTAGLVGCGVGTSTTESAATLLLQGRVHGGQQPVGGATIHLYAMGTGGNGSAATEQLLRPVTTDRYGAFTLTGDYTCPSASTQMYVVARGGNPGLPGNVDNAALTMMTVVGRCGDLLANPGRVIAVNEVSTVAAGYALAPFMTSFDHVGATATNAVGLANAVGHATEMVNPLTGMAAVLPGNVTLEQDKMYALADALVSCVNSDGGTACAPLLTATTVNGTAPTDTVGALLNVVKNPGRNVAAVWNCIGPTPAYATGLSVAPSDWTMSMTVTGGGLVQPQALGIDAAGNVWAANAGSSGPAGLVAFSPRGVPFTGSPFGVGVQTDAYGLTVDKNGDVWVTSSDNLQGSGVGSVAKFMGASRATPGALAGQFTDATLVYPQAVASDPTGSGSVLIANYVGGSVTVYGLNGDFLRNLGGGIPVYPNSVVSDGAGGAWVGDQGDNNVAHLLVDGTVQTIACCEETNAVNMDRHNQLWAASYLDAGLGYGFSVVASDGSLLIDENTGAGLYAPVASAVDAGGQFWVLNQFSSSASGNGSFSEIAGSDAGVALGTAMSPVGGFGLDARLQQPTAMAADASGDVWVTNLQSNSLTAFLGMATPTATPATPTPQAP